MPVVRVPKTPKSSFNPHRRPPALLLEQIRHLEWAALPAAQRGPDGDLPRRTVTTEGAAAERIAQLAALIRRQQEITPTPGVVVPVTLPPIRGARKRTARKARAPKRASATGRTSSPRHSSAKPKTKAATTRRTQTAAQRGRRARKQR